jgi:hypothetical protein
VDWDGYTDPNPPPPTSSTEDTSESPPQKEKTPLVGHWNERLSEFHKLIMVRTFKEEKVNT